MQPTPATVLVTLGPAVPAMLVQVAQQMLVQAALQMRGPAVHAMPVQVVGAMPDRVAALMPAPGVLLMLAQVAQRMRVQAVLQMLGPGVHAMPVQVGHAIRVRVADGTARPFADDAHEQTEYEFQLIKGEQPNAKKRLTRREVLVKGLGPTALTFSDFIVNTLRRDLKDLLAARLVCNKEVFN